MACCSRCEDSCTLAPWKMIVSSVQELVYLFGLNRTGHTLLSDRDPVLVPPLGNRVCNTSGLTSSLNIFLLCTNTTRPSLTVTVLSLAYSAYPHVSSRQAPATLRGPGYVPPKKRRRLHYSTSITFFGNHKRSGMYDKTTRCKFLILSQ